MVRNNFLVVLLSAFYTVSAVDNFVVMPVWAAINIATHASRPVSLSFDKRTSTLFYAGSTNYFRTLYSGVLTDGDGHVYDGRIKSYDTHSDTVILKLTRSGHLEWWLPLRAWWPDWPVSMILMDSNNKLSISGYWDFFDMWVDSVNGSRMLKSSPSAGSYLTVYSSDGNLQWVAFIEALTLSFSCCFLATDNTHSIYAAGHFSRAPQLTDSSGNIIQDLTRLSTNSNNDCIIFKFSATGLYVWNVVFSSISSARISVTNIISRNQTEVLAFGVADSSTFRRRFNQSQTITMSFPAATNSRGLASFFFLFDESGSLLFQSLIYGNGDQVITDARFDATSASLFVFGYSTQAPTFLTCQQNESSPLLISSLQNVAWFSKLSYFECQPFWTILFTSDRSVASVRFRFTQNDIFISGLFSGLYLNVTDARNLTTTIFRINDQYPVSSASFVARFSKLGHFIWCFQLDANETGARVADIEIDEVNWWIYVTGSYTNTTVTIYDLEGVALNHFLPAIRYSRIESSFTVGYDMWDPESAEDNDPTETEESKNETPITTHIETSHVPSMTTSTIFEEEIYVVETSTQTLVSPSNEKAFNLFGLEGVTLYAALGGACVGFGLFVSGFIYGAIYLARRRRQAMKEFSPCSVISTATAQVSVSPTLVNRTKI